ncbi:MAG: hypothetical protein JWP89_6900 [Schlesneria sp.]|nr:hypothetical protein [Schlesneria sp.]
MSLLGHRPFAVGPLARLLENASWDRNAQFRGSVDLCSGHCVRKKNGLWNDFLRDADGRLEPKLVEPSESRCMYSDRNQLRNESQREGHIEQGGVFQVDRIDPNLSMGVTA